MIKSLYKNEIADMCGSTLKDLRAWLKMPKQKEEFEKMGISPCARKLMPKAVKYILENYGGIEDVEYFFNNF